jgi:sigma-B regulation protein RsbQ
MATTNASARGPGARLGARRSGRREARALLLVHGFGCDQSVWDAMRPRLDERYAVLSYDLAGAGASDPEAYDPARYRSLDAHVEDLLDLVRESDLHEVVVVAHSIGATLTMLAAVAEPERFEALALIGASARYVDDGAYHGGLTPGDVDELLELMATNWEAWSAATAPHVMANADRPELGTALQERFLRFPASAGQQLGELTFRADVRAHVGALRVPTAFLQTSHDPVVPETAATWLHEHVPGSEQVRLRAEGHLPQLADPEETAAAVLAFFARTVVD